MRAVRGVWGHAPPENLEIYKLINALVSISHGIFLQKSPFWASVEVHFLIAQRYWCQVNDHPHFKAFEVPLLTVHMKRINLIKMLFPLNSSTIYQLVLY